MRSFRFLPLVLTFASSAASAAAPFYVINNQDLSVWAHTGGGDSWSKIGTRVSDMAANGAVVVAINADEHTVWASPDPVGGVGFTQIGARSKEVELTDAHCYVINDQDGAVWSYSGSGMDWSKVADHTAHIAAFGDALYRIDANDATVWANPAPNNGGTWTRIGVAAAELRVAAGNVYVIDNDKHGIWRYNGAPDNWSQVGKDAKDLAATGNALYAIHSDGTVWMNPNATMGDSWTQIGVRSARIAASGGDVYVINNQDAAVWKWRGTGMDWDRIGGQAGGIVSAP